MIPESSAGTRQDFAPVSREPSTRLKLAAGYFRLVGGMTLGIIGGVIVFGGLLMPAGLLRMVTGQPGAAGAAVITAAGMFWTGRALRERSRAGWYSALLTMVAPAIGLAAGKTPSIAALVLSAVGVLLLMSVTDELE